MKRKAVLMDENQIKRALTRIAHEILEREKEEEFLVLGIKRRGESLAQELTDRLRKFSSKKISCSFLDISLYRDDLSEKYKDPQVKTSSLSKEDLAGKTVLLVDDVLYTGRTVRAALDAIVDIARPKAIRLVVLIDRGHRELPIRADYVGKNVPTSTKETIIVQLPKWDNICEVILAEVES